MNKLLILFILILNVSMILYSQSINEIQAWANQQKNKYNSKDVAAFINENRSGSEITFTEGFVYSTIYPGPPAITTLDESRFVIAYRLGTQYADGVAIIGTINDSIITFSPEFTFSIGTTYPISVCSMDSNTIVIAYKSNNLYPNPDDGAVIVGEIIGDTISFGSEFIFNPGHTEYISVISLDSEHFIVEYLDGWDRYDTAYVNLGTISGDTVSFSNEVLMCDGWIVETSATSLDSSNFVVTYSNADSAGGGTARAGTVIGDSITLGPENIFSYLSPWCMSATTLNDSCFVVAYNEASIYTKAIVGMVDDNIITFGNATIFEYNRIENVCAITMDENHFVLSYEDRENLYTTIGKTILGTVSGFNISFGDEYTFSNYSNTHPCPSTALDPNHFVTIFVNSNNSWLGTAKLGTILPSPVLTIASSNITCAGVHSVPILVYELNDVAEFSLFLAYDTTNLTYTSYQNINTQLISDSLSVTDNSGEINISYSSNIPVSILTDTLIELIFNVDTIQYYNIENLTWNDSLSYYINISGDSVETNFENGNIHILASVGDIGPIIGSDSICQGTLSETYMIEAILNGLTYTWNLVPDIADSIIVHDTTATVYFQSGYNGSAALSVYGSNYCGNSDTSYLNINIIAHPSSTAGSDTTICENVSCTLNGSANNYDHVYWATLGDGNFDNPFLLNPTYTPGDGDISNGNASLILFAYAISPCLGEVGDTLNLAISYLPEVDAGYNDSMCAGNSYLLNGMANYYSSINWTTFGDGSFNDTTQLSTYYLPGPNDIDNGSVYLFLTAFPLSPCVEIVSDSILISILTIPSQPNTPQGPVVIILDTCLSTEYFTDTVENAISYIWYLEPLDAGIISGIGINAIVNWNQNFTGVVAYIYVEAVNECGETSSDSLIVDISPVGLSLQSNKPEITISPNPSKGMFNISIKGSENYADLSVINANGMIIKQKRIKMSGNEYVYKLDLSNELSGIYYVRFIIKNVYLIKKIFVYH